VLAVIATDDADSQKLTVRDHLWNVKRWGATATISPAPRTHLSTCFTGRRSSLTPRRKRRGVYFNLEHQFVSLPLSVTHNLPTRHTAVTSDLLQLCMIIDQINRVIATETNPLIRRESTMNTTDLNTSCLAHTAIAALKKAYEECGDKAVNESIIIAYKAIIQLHHDLEKYIKIDSTSESDSGFDPSEYCAAV
jgi:hypothetical protein